MATSIIPDLQALYSIVYLGVAKCIGVAGIDVSIIGQQGLFVNDSKGGQSSGWDHEVGANAHPLTARIFRQRLQQRARRDNARPIGLIYGDNEQQDKTYKNNGTLSERCHFSWTALHMVTGCSKENHQHFPLST
jgi:hypothetical protein